MGYKREGNIFKLRFADEEYNGLVVRAKSVSLGEFIQLAELAELKGKVVTIDDMPKVNKLFEMFSKALVSWNLEDDDGTPVPATLEGLYSQDVEFVMAIIMSWMEAVAGVSTPLVPPSIDGVPFPVDSIPMETR